MNSRIPGLYFAYLFSRLSRVFHCPLWRQPTKLEIITLFTECWSNHNHKQLIRSKRLSKLSEKQKITLLWVLGIITWPVFDQNCLSSFTAWVQAEFLHLSNISRSFFMLERLRKINICIILLSPYNLSIIKNISYLWTGRMSLKISVLLSSKIFIDLNILRIIRCKWTTMSAKFHNSKLIFYIVFLYKNTFFNFLFRSKGESTCRDNWREIIKGRIWFSLINIYISFL